MSLTTIDQSTKDEALRDRILASVSKEAWNNEDFGATEAGQTVRALGPSTIIDRMIWPCCLDFEEAYAYAVDSDNPNPGGDPGVITDEAIGSAVQAHWPPDPDAEPEP